MTKKKPEEKPVSSEEEIQTEPSEIIPDEPVDEPQLAPLDFSKLLENASSVLPDLKDMFTSKKKDPSTMCEFTIKGSDEFVLDCLDLILKK